MGKKELNEEKTSRTNWNRGYAIARNGPRGERRPSPSPGFRKQIVEAGCDSAS